MSLSASRKSGYKVIEIISKIKNLRRRDVKLTLGGGYLESPLIGGEPETSVEMNLNPRHSARSSNCLSFNRTIQVNVSKFTYFL